MRFFAKSMRHKAGYGAAAIGAAITLVLMNVNIGSAAPTLSKPCNDLSRSCLIEVAETYVHAQAGGTGTAAAMRLAPAAMRWENGVVTGTSGDDIRSKSGFTNPIYSQRDTNRAWVADGNQVFIFWIVDIRSAANGPFVATAHIGERIQIGHGRPVCGLGQLSPCVTQVEAVFCIAPHGMEPARPDPVTPEPNALCNRAG